MRGSASGFSTMNTVFILETFTLIHIILPQGRPTRAPVPMQSSTKAGNRDKKFPAHFHGMCRLLKKTGQMEADNMKKTPIR
jgi:hypothetical protein